MIISRSFGRWVDKENVVHVCNGVLISRKREWSNAIHCNMDGLGAYFSLRVKILAMACGPHMICPLAVVNAHSGFSFKTPLLYTKYIYSIIIMKETSNHNSRTVKFLFYWTLYIYTSKHKLKNIKQVFSNSPLWANYINTFFWKIKEKLIPMFQLVAKINTNI